MTTIAYHHGSGVIAYDSRAMFGDEVMTDCCDKRRERAGLSFFLAADFSDAAIDAFIDAYPDGKCKFDVYALVFDGDAVRVASIDGGHITTCMLDCSYAIGTGAPYALGAMDAGAGAKQAVKVARGRDPNTGGRVRAFDVAANYKTAG